MEYFGWCGVDKESGDEIGWRSRETFVIDKKRRGAAEWNLPLGGGGRSFCGALF
jgi:hypothetical protein